MAEHPFIVGVMRELDRLDDRAAQDEADFILLGGTVTRVPETNPECGWCWGGGWVCPCHGIATGCNRGPRERCECVRETVYASTRNGSPPHLLRASHSGEDADNETASGDAPKPSGEDTQQ